MLHVYDSHGPDGYWEHGHPPCEACLKYHKYVEALREGLRVIAECPPAAVSICPTAAQAALAKAKAVA